LPIEWIPYGVVIALGLASALAALPSLATLLTERLSLQASWAAVRATLGDGAWASGGVVVTHIQSQSYVYLFGALAGLTVTAEANAARLLLMPVSLAFTSVQRVFYPRWLVLAREGRESELSLAARRLFTLTTLGMLAYAVLIAAASSPIIRSLMGPAYAAS